MYERPGICQGCGEERTVRDVATKKMEGILTLCKACRKPESIIQIRKAFMSGGKAGQRRGSGQ